jgi:1,5-anhydro-D-fructose reductase (1,5-anhydro-D-mannitol-forming)
MSRNDLPTTARDGQVGWALVGASAIAELYMIDAFRRAVGGRLVGVLSSDPERGARFAAANEIPRAYASAEELYDDAEVSAVYVSTVNAKHASDTIAAARAGRHVLCDKPLASTVEDARAMVAECERAGVLLGMNNNLRCAPVNRALRRLVQEGRLGEVHGARIFFGADLPDAMRTWRTQDADAGGGTALDLTVHETDLLRYVLDDEVTEVCGIGCRQDSRTSGVEDALAGALRFSRGTLASFHDSFNMPFATTGLELHGTLGSVVAVDALADDPIGRATLRDGTGVHEVVTDPSPGLYVELVEAFNAAVAGEGRLVATGVDGLRAVEISTAARDGGAS